MKDKFLRLSLWIGFVTLLALWIWGFLSNPKMFQIWSGRDLSQLVIFSLAYLSLGLFFFWCRIPFGPVSLVLALAMAIFTLGPTPVFGPLYFLISSLLLGDFLVYGKKGKAEDCLEILLSLLLGAGIFMILTGISVHFKINYPLFYWLVLSLPLLFNGRKIALYGGLVREFFHQKTPVTLGKHLSLSLLSLILTIHLIHVFRPEIGWDALSVHLNIASSVFYHHRWAFDFNTAIWAFMPMGGDWIYTITFMLGGEFGARLTNYSFFLLGGALLFWTIKNSCSKEIAFLLTALFVSLPLTQLETGSLFIDNIWMTFLLGTFVAALKFRERQEKGYLFMTGLLMGASLSCKVISVFFIGPLGLFLLWEIFSLRKKLSPLKNFFTFSLIFFICGFIPYGYSYLRTGNPVFPFMNGLFKSPYYMAVNFNNPLWNHPLHLSSLFDMTFHSHKYLESTDGSFGFSFLVLLPLSFLAISRKYSYLGWSSLVISFLFFGMVFHFQSYLRYLYPAFPLFVILIALLFQRVQSLDKKLYWALGGFCVVSIVLNVYFMPASGWYHREFPLKIILDKSDHEKYISFHAPERKIVEYLNLTYGKSTRVAFLSRPFLSHFQGYGVTNCWFSYDFSNSLSQASSAEEVLKVIKKYSLTHLIFSREEVLGRLTAAQKAFLKKYTRHEYRCGPIDLVAFKKEFIFTTELVKNGSFQRGLKFWDRFGKVQPTPKGTALVNGKNTMSQPTLISDKSRYRYSITARSKSPGALVRLQVNWLNSSGEFLGTTLIPKECTGDFQNFTKEMKAPEGASLGIVYVGGHGEEWIEVKKISFKGP